MCKDHCTKKKERKANVNKSKKYRTNRLGDNSKDVISTRKINDKDKFDQSKIMGSSNLNPLPPKETPSEFNKRENLQIAFVDNDKNMDNNLLHEKIKDEERNSGVTDQKTKPRFSQNKTLQIKINKLRIEGVDLNSSRA